MEYWLAVVDELADRTGVDFPDGRREMAAEILQSAASVHSDYAAPSQRAPAPVVETHTPERTKAWWEDVSKLSGSDWLLARRIHDLIASRHA